MRLYRLTLEVNVVKLSRLNFTNLQVSPPCHRLNTAYLQQNEMLLSTETAISTFFHISLEFFRNRTHTPSGGGCGDVRLPQGPLRSASIFLPWLIVPLPLGAQGSTLHNGPGPSPCNMSGMWNILTPWVGFCGHVCEHSLLSTRTSCETEEEQEIS